MTFIPLGFHHFLGKRGGGGGYSLEFLLEGVRLGSPNPDPISDQTDVIFPYSFSDLGVGRRGFFSNDTLNHSAEGSLLRIGNTKRWRENPSDGREQLQKSPTYLKMLYVTGHCPLNQT